jgi:hypothetical protein
MQPPQQGHGLTTGLRDYFLASIYVAKPVFSLCITRLLYRLVTTRCVRNRIFFPHPGGHATPG